MARPTKYTKKLGDKICAAIAGGKPLVKICKKSEMPSTVTVYAWLRKHPEFLNNYEIAKSDQADYMVDEMLEIADEAEPENVQVQRLRVDTRKWAASKFKPKKYGDSSTIDVTSGGDKIENNWNVEFVNAAPESKS